MSILLTWIGLARPPHAEAATVIRTFLSTLDRLSAAASHKVHR